MENGIIYARFSSQSQNEQSIEAQIRICSEFAENKGIKIVNVYSDKAKTGTNTDRPAFQKMVSDAQTGAFKYIIVYMFDRFARNRRDSVMYKEMLKEILPVFIENHTPYMIFTTNGFYSTLEPDYVRDRFAYRGSVRFGNKMEDFLPGGPMSDSPACQIQQFDSIDEFIKKDLDIIKVEAFSHDEFEIQKVLPYFKDMKKIAYLSSYPDNVEITNENAQKGLILEKVIDLLNIKKEEVIVLGDGMNDITLFERFPYSFAPNNAEKVIQEKAYKVVSSCKDGAVSEAIEYALENL